MKKVEHIGIAVSNLEEAEKTYSDVLGVKPYKREEVESEGVITSFFQCGDSKVELLVGTNFNSPISKFIEKRGPGIHHIAFKVEDIHSEIKRLKALGYTLINQNPKKGADDKLIAFLHPKSTEGVLIELCQDK